MTHVWMDFYSDLVTHSEDGSNNPDTNCGRDPLTQLHAVRRANNPVTHAQRGRVP